MKKLRPERPSEGCEVNAVPSSSSRFPCSHWTSVRELVTPAELTLKGQGPFPAPQLLCSSSSPRTPGLSCFSSCLSDPVLQVETTDGSQEALSLLSTRVSDGHSEGIWQSRRPGWARHGRHWHWGFLSPHWPFQSHLARGRPPWLTKPPPSAVLEACSERVLQDLISPAGLPLTGSGVASAQSVPITLPQSRQSMCSYVGPNGQAYWTHDGVRALSS